MIAINVKKLTHWKPTGSKKLQKMEGNHPCGLAMLKISNAPPSKFNLNHPSQGTIHLGQDLDE